MEGGSTSITIKITTCQMANDFAPFNHHLTSHSLELTKWEEEEDSPLAVKVRERLLDKGFILDSIGCKVGSCHAGFHLNQVACWTSWAGWAAIATSMAHCSSAQYYHGHDSHHLHERGHCSSQWRGYKLH